MNKDKTIERLRAKLAEKDQEVKALKKEVKELKVGSKNYLLLSTQNRHASL